MATKRATPTATPEQSNTGDQDKAISELLNRIRDIRDRSRWVGSTQEGSDYTLGYIGAMCDATLEKFSPIGSSENEIPF